MQKVLITSTGSVAADIVIKNIKALGYYIVGCNIYPKEWIVESNFVDKFYQSIPINRPQEYIDFIKDLCLKENISFVFPMIDYEIDILIRHWDWFKSKGITLCCSEPSTINLIRDKIRLLDFIKNKVPELNPIPTKFYNDYQFGDWKLPLVCKPNNGRSSQGLKYIFDDQDWDNFKSNIQNKEKYIIEPLIEGAIVVVEIVRQPFQNKEIAIIRRELISTPHGCSLTVYLYEDPILERYCKKLAAKLGIIGNVNFELIQDFDGQYHFIECNPRFSAGCEFTCMAGYNIILNHLNCFLNRPIDDFSLKHNMTIARTYQEFITSIDNYVSVSKTIK